MICKNCQSEMEEYDDRYWCSECGTGLSFICCGGREIWAFPKSVERTKKLVAELIKCRDHQSYLNDRLNSIDKADCDRVDFSEER